MSNIRWLGALLIILIAAFGVSQASAQTGGYGGGCFQAPRLLVGQQARVTTFPNLPNRIRTDPSFYAAQIGLIPAGSSFSVVNGPYCDGVYHWWQVTYAGITGWTIEGDGAYTYYLEPSFQPPPPACRLPTRLTVGATGRVTPGLPNVVRTGAGLSGTTRLGTIPAGAQFAVTGGPVCASDGRWWWAVNYRGLAGWTAEGDMATGYWLEVAAGTGTFCPLPNRLFVGGFGRITPGLPNVMRDAPGTRATGSISNVIGYIPAGGIFHVLEGPQCGSDGRWWWRVDYNGFVGWTGEGEGTNIYWVDPV
jgi:uncharacterized protein YraI